MQNEYKNKKLDEQENKSKECMISPKDKKNAVLNDNNYSYPLEAAIKLSESINILTKSITINMVNFLDKFVNYQLTFVNESAIESITKSMTELANRIVSIQKNFVDNFLELGNPFFEELSNAILEVQTNPNCIVNWYDYYDKLSEFFWIMPYNMSAEQLFNILENVENEKDFDAYLIKYFDKEKVESLVNDIKVLLKTKKEKMLLEQIIISYNHKGYALANCGLISLIDNLLSFYLINKGCSSRVGLFDPIIKDLISNDESYNKIIFIVMMTNSNINLLYENVEFNSKIKIKTHKKSRRNPISHGKSYSNKKIDSIMLLNTVYYLLIVQKELYEYKDRISYNGKKKEFSILTKKEKNEMKKQIKENLKNKK